MKRWEVINHLIQKNGYTRYLEIGVQARQCFNQIRIPFKFGVDPKPMAPVDFLGTSDVFFTQNQETFDIIFIDGDHTAEQAYKDIINSQKCLKENGTIVLHDCNPTSERMQRPKRVTSQWTGDVWKAFVYYRQEIDPHSFVIDSDWGLGIIDDWQIPVVVEPSFDILELNYPQLSAHRTEWLNLKSVQEFLEM